MDTGDDPVPEVNVSPAIPKPQQAPYIVFSYKLSPAYCPVRQRGSELSVPVPIP